MAKQKKIRRHEAQLAFDALSIEGGLLSPEWLARAAQLDASQQQAADYRVPKGLNLRDEIGRYWRMAQAMWSEFQGGMKNHVDARFLTDRLVVQLLRDAFGFASLQSIAPIVEGERTFPLGYAALGGSVPVVIGRADQKFDLLANECGDATRRRSAFGLCQDFLNGHEGALWGIVSNGLLLRILRDNASLTRPAWIEADLERIFTEERYADFAALWLLAHESRFGREGQTPNECPLEQWRTAGREEGTRARETLRSGVEDALKALGQGFLSHPENGALRQALADGALTKDAYFQQLLRLVYRLIFLLTVEERDLLHPPKTPEPVRKLYADGYAIRRLRERAVRRSAHDRFSDLFDGARIVFRALATGQTRLGLPALAGLFAADQCAALDAARLENRALLVAVFRLAWMKVDGGLARVNWRDMGPEELGSVYESLLELVPQLTPAPVPGGRTFAFATGGEQKGNARKTTGSYYTPDSLVQVLLDSALEPVIADTIAANPQKPVDALLKLSIVDPACGSGHFLLAAARRLAGHVARLEAGGTPSASQYRHALRQVVGHCIYGVDLNPMAVELCKVSLWMEAVEPGLPLTFLNAHIQHGNALLGATPALLEAREGSVLVGIPDNAFEAVEGDDRKFTSELRKRNKSARTQRSLFAASGEAVDFAALRTQMEAVDALADESLAAVHAKADAYEAYLASPEYQRAKFLADAWCSAFVWRKVPDSPTITNEEFLAVREGRMPAESIVAEIRRLTQQYAFFHWHLAFPDVIGEDIGRSRMVAPPPKLSAQGSLWS
jgi:hypothetical protein